MTGPRDPLAAFDDGVVEAVAAETGVPLGTLRDLIRRHQRLIRENPGVDDLLYEWRKYYPYDPLVARTDRAFHVVLLERVWREFTDRLCVSDAERRALLAVHDRQARTEAADGDVFEGGAPMVLTRP